MKTLKFYFLAIAVLMLSHSSFAQVSIGLKTGVNIAGAHVSGPINDFLPELESNTGFTAGLWSEIPMLNGFSFRPELNYTQKGFRAMGNIDFLDINAPVGLGVRTRMNTIETPLLFKYSQGNDIAKAYIILGPTVSYTTDAFATPIARFIIDFNIPNQKIDLSNDVYRRWELSGTIGLGGELKAGQGKVFGDVRFNQGISTLLNNPIIDLDIRNRSWGVHVGYAYTF